MSHDQDVRLYTFEGAHIPLVIEPETTNTNLDAWLESNKNFVDSQLARHGALLFRGFGIRGDDEFPAVVNKLCDEALSYVYRSTPRTQVGKNIYTATEYPAHKSIPLHNEEAFKRDWPMRLIFFCSQPAQQGGETPIADTLRVTARISPEIKQTFARKKVMYVRNYGTGVDLSWQTVFQTESKVEVEQYCRDHDIEFEWKPDGCLRTWQICQGLAEHPSSGDLIWFNQAHLFHVSSLDEKTRKAMLSVYAEDQLPRNSYYGDGSKIEAEVLEHIRAAFEAETIVFPWRKHDVMLLDNMLVSHARKPFSGQRRTLVGMGNAYSAATKSVAISA
jgi:alpha-ketoglutarate-dependent taurine dioxygenase